MNLLDTQLIGPGVTSLYILFILSSAGYRRAPDEYARFRINRPTITTPTRHESNLHRDIWNLKVLHSTSSKKHRPKLYNDYESEDKVQHPLHHRRGYWNGVFARRFDGEKHIASVTEHATQLIKELERRFDGKKNIVIEDNQEGPRKDARVQKQVRSGSPMTMMMTEVQ